MPLHSKRIFIVSVLTAIIAAGTGCSITRSYEPRFEVVSLTIEPVPLRREQVEDPVTETAIVVSPDSTFTFKNLRTIPCQLREYSIEYTFVSFEKPLPNLKANSGAPYNELLVKNARIRVHDEGKLLKCRLILQEALVMPIR